MSIGANENSKFSQLQLKLKNEEQQDNGFDSEEDVNKELKSLVIQSPDKERKEKLKVKLMEQSQQYYQNNLNIFSNGISLLAANSLEVHGLVHQVNNQTEAMADIISNVNVHSTFTKKKTREMVKNLKLIH